MADNTIEYKVNIDTSSLADQLQQIKNQVDQAMASYTFQATTPVLATQFGPSNIQPQAFGPPAGPNLFGQFNEDIMSGSRIAATQWTNFYQSGKLGFQKFTQDIQNTALSIPIDYPTFRPSEMNWKPDMSQWSGWRTRLEAVTGFSYDPHMSVSRGDYMRHAEARFEDNALRNVGPMIGGTAGTLIGGALGTMTGIPGMGLIGGFVGGTLGNMTADATYKLFAATTGQDFDAAMNMRSWINNTSWRFLGGQFSRDQATEMGFEATHVGRTPALEGFRVSLKDVQETMRIFTEAGGFDFVRTADDFSQKLKMVVGSIDRVKQSLNMSPTEAAGFIASMQRFGLAENAPQVAALSTNMQAQAYTAGYSQQELIQFGEQTAEIVRGTGINMGQAFLGGQNTLASLRAMIRNDRNLDLELINQMGGVENMATTINRLGYAWGMGPAGLRQIAAQRFYGDQQLESATDLFETQYGAASYIGASVPRLLELQGQQSREVSRRDPEAMFLTQSAQFGMQAAMIGRLIQPGTPLSEDQMVGIARMQGMNENEARLRIAELRNTTRRRRVLEEGLVAEGELYRQTPAITSVALDRLENAVAESGPIQWVNRTARTINQALTDTGRFFQNVGTGVLQGYVVDYSREGNIIDLMRETSFWQPRVDRRPAEERAMTRESIGRNATTFRGLDVFLNRIKPEDFGAENIEQLYAMSKLPGFETKILDVARAKLDRTWADSEANAKALATVKLNEIYALNLDPRIREIAINEQARTLENAAQAERDRIEAVIRKETGDDTLKLPTDREGIKTVLRNIQEQQSPEVRSRIGAMIPAIKEQERSIFGKIVEYAKAPSITGGDIQAPISIETTARMAHAVSMRADKLEDVRNIVRQYTPEKEFEFERGDVAGAFEQLTEEYPDLMKRVYQEIRGKTETRTVDLFGQKVTLPPSPVFKEAPPEDKGLSLSSRMSKFGPGLGPGLVLGEKILKTGAELVADQGPLIGATEALRGITAMQTGASFHIPEILTEYMEGITTLFAMPGQQEARRKKDIQKASTERDKAHQHAEQMDLAMESFSKTYGDALEITKAFKTKDEKEVVDEDWLKEHAPDATAAATLDMARMMRGPGINVRMVQ